MLTAVVLNTVILTEMPDISGAHCRVEQGPQNLGLKIVGAKEITLRAPGDSVL